MKTISALLCLFALSACSHVYVSHWNKEYVTTCCPHGKILCTENKMTDLAKDKCGGEAEAVSGGTVRKGASASFSDYGASVRDSDDKCITFKCN